MLDTVNKLVWILSSSLLIMTSIYFSIKFKFIQLNIVKILKSIFDKSSNNFKTLMFSLSGRVGVGSIAGVALGIYLGGPGAIFWMWIMGILCAILTFVETGLANYYKEKDEDGLYIGGPSYYLLKVANNKLLSALYTIILFFCYVGGIIAIQSNTIASSIEEIANVNTGVIGGLLCLITGVVIFGSLKKIIKVSSVIVPFMTILYLFSAIYLVIINPTDIFLIFLNILKSAFTSESFIFGLLPTIIVGIQRGIFSNESGLGTGAILSATSNSKNPVSQGYLQILGVYITTLLICTASAIIIMSANIDFSSFSNVNGIELVQRAFYLHYGNIGIFIMIVSIFLFSFTSILTGYYYGEYALKFIFKKVNNRKKILLKVFILINIFIGCVFSSLALWKLVDILIAFLAVINIYALYKLYPTLKNN